MKLIKQKQNCSGCSACASICPNHCITMKEDKEGFLYPFIDDTQCINCGKCKSRCPVFQQRKVQRKPKAFAAYSKHDSVREASSSGGLFTELAQQVLQSGGAVFGASFDDCFHVVHTYVQNTQDLNKLRGSKYVQSSIGDAYAETEALLKEGRKVYFSGTPCQISGLKTYLEKDYENLVCQDLICHGTPSPKVWRNYVRFREDTAQSSAHKISFRNKTQGWQKFSLLFQFINGTEYRQTLDCDSYLHLFLSNVCLRPSCSNCAFKGLDRQSDITLADFWGVNQMMPSMFDDKGTSLVIVNTDKGKKLFDSISDSVIVKPVDFNQAIQYNPAIGQSVEASPKRESFFTDLEKEPFEEVLKKYGSDSFSTKIKRKTKGAIKQTLSSLGMLDKVKQWVHR
ncbi:Coenzyme F420 hydrogenase/dehydrogenase, beta subunit C-terminal domain [Caproicibacterium lactatifermentans]|jgi:coenzyme F420-reducing hydrogenase beta subunit|uniref:4Fe-4S dicluster domain-containing protein n=1 Tax=Caproicibacterium lactatifermentans TaxID=2666138 RepID=A0A859DPE2_9FIRM|nr:Coenzyme F420 hydrogenase/dehydrogenase, beta subunit C-terminal domain [Caproicibacterium lactatifermentans]QKN23698.1 4Fe-4S dicluster domain-containing protein [Caproicibacterium lactatifermentans]